jgi:hypothetical protein
MNSNVLMAFFGGAVLASGIVYMAVRPESTPKTVSVAVTKPVREPEAAAPVAPQAPQSPVVSTESPKPSPMPAPVRRERPARLAQVAEVRNRPSEPIVPQRPVGDARPEPPVNPAPPQPAAPPPAPVEPPAQVQPAPEPPPRVELPPPPPEPHTVTIPAGTVLNVRIGETLSTRHNQPGDTFLATLDQPLVVDGFVIAERGARAEGRVSESDPGGRVQGVSHLAVELVKLSTADGQHVRIRTASLAKQANSSVKQDAAKIGAGAAIGAAIGAIAGGGKGAGIGAGVGGAAGAGDVLLTRGKQAEIPVETRVAFRLSDPVTLTERLN